MNLEKELRFVTSRVVTTVFDRILDAINVGQLEPGERISDIALATEFGVSRTPVREALQRLREIGLIEASASRFTRVAVVSPDETVEAMVVWLALYKALIAEVTIGLSADVLNQMAADNEEFDKGVKANDMRAVATANFAFFARPMTASKNETLVRALTSVVYRIRLGSLHLPSQIDFELLGQAQIALLKSLREQNAKEALNAVRLIGKIRIPVS